MNERIGLGWDLHRLEEGCRLILGGVEIPFEKGLLGHSDADVLAHAVTDALLGACGLPDIGECFPDTDPTYEGADSLILLSRAAEMAEKKGYRPVNCDCVIVCQKPKLAPYKREMALRLSTALGITPEQINIKAKTAEGLGPEGESLAVSAQAVMLVTKS
jgi:2-C-methyl-D-erythritol 2,4-cyclodiphosphate synthase